MKSFAAVALLVCLTPLAAAGEEAAAERLSPRALAQIEAIMRDKSSRHGVETKMSLHLVSALREAQGQKPIGGLKGMRSAVVPDAKGNTLVDVRAAISKNLIDRVEHLGGRVIASSSRYAALRVELPLARVADLAGFPAVRFVAPPARARTESIRPPYDVSDRIARVRETVAAAIPNALGQGAIVSEGDVAHRADVARPFFGVDGTGVKIGVLSDSVDFLADSQAGGELPDVTVLQDIDPPGTGSGEGTAMLEIVHDLAPGAELLFASAFNGDFSFADNIRALRDAGCDVIVDDVFYFNESPFQDGIIAKAVEDVTKDGASYFSSAGNSGNLNDGTAGVWEGDFKSGGTPFAILPGTEVHDFGRGNFSNRQLAQGSANFLHWSDPAGRAKNDYDLIILDAGMQNVVDFSADVQDGDDDPLEFVFPGAFPGERNVIVKFSGKARALHLTTNRGRLGTPTGGQTHGHNSVRTDGAWGVAAVDAFLTGGGPFSGGQENPVETFSSDGQRKVFFDAAGKQFGKGTPVWSNDKAGETRRKPDISAADGVSTSVPGFEAFFGTSAAAPHAAAIAGLVKQAKPASGTKKLRKAFTKTALDIEAPKVDRDSGWGIVDAMGALTAAGAAPKAFLRLDSLTAQDNPGDSDGAVEPGEPASLSVTLKNAGGAGASAISATLSSGSPDVTISSGTSAYADLSAGASAANSTPFTFTLSGGAGCGVAVPFEQSVMFTGGASPATFAFSVPTGEAAPPVTTSYGGAPVAIPDDNPTGVDATVAVAGIGLIKDVDFSIDGTSCNTTAGSTTVGLDHTWVSDLELSLTSPGGTTVLLVGGTGGSGNNFCQTVLDDSAATSIQGLSSALAPFTGTFRPAQALSAFIGEDPVGTWTVHVADFVGGDIGSLRAFSLIITGAVCN